MGVGDISTCHPPQVGWLWGANSLKKLVWLHPAQLPTQLCPLQLIDNS